MEHTPANTAGNGQKKGFKLSRSSVIVTIVLVIALLGAILAWKTFSPDLVKKDQYQAVFLTNGQVYFGKLESGGPQFLRLKEVYYLQTAENSDQNTEANAEQPTDNQTQTLIRLGKEIHGPDNEMLISRDQVLFFENISNDGTVGKAIKSDKEKK